VVAPPSLRVTTTGRSACSARQLVASTVESKKQLKIAANSVVRCAAKRWMAGVRPGCSRRVPSRLMTRPRATASPWGLSVPWCARSVAHREDVLQRGLHLRGQAGARVVEAERARPTQQVCETRLMGRRRESPIGGPAIAHQDAREVVPQDRRRLGEAPAGLNRVDRGVGRGEYPQPPEPGRDLPPRFIGDDHRAPAHRGTQRGDAAERHAELDVQQGAQCDHRGPQLHGGGPQGVRRLQGMTPLHPTVALLAPPHMDRKGPDHRADRRQVNLRLGGDPRLGHGPPTIRTGGRQGRVVPLVDSLWGGPTPSAAVGGSGLAPGAAGRASRSAAREGSRLTKPGTPGRVQLPLQPVDLALQPGAARMLGRNHETSPRGPTPEDLARIERLLLDERSTYEYLMPTALVWDVDGAPPSGDWTTILWRDFGTKGDGLVSMPRLVEECAVDLRARYLGWVYDLGQGRVSGRRVVEHLELRPGF
jgi:hypothetical protein